MPRDKLGQRCRLDEEWISELGREEEWAILSGDVNIARKRPQRALFFRSSLVGFFPRAAVMELPLPKKAARILSVWDRMVGLARDVRPGMFESNECPLFPIAAPERTGRNRPASVDIWQPIGVALDVGSWQDLPFDTSPGAAEMSQTGSFEQVIPRGE